MLLMLRNKPVALKMNHDTTSDPDLAEAAKELDELFPGIEYDDSIQKYLRQRELDERRRKKLLSLPVHGFFYAAFTLGFSFLTHEHGLGLFANMMWALSYFAFYFLLKEYCKDILNDTRKPESFDEISRPKDSGNYN